MDARKILIAMLILLLAGSAFAVDGAVQVYADANAFYPGRTNTINFVISDKDAPVDANIQVFYLNSDTYTRVEITSGVGALDRNAGTYCSDGITDTNLLCSLTWTLPVGLDFNYLIDVNFWDNDTGDDQNALSPLFYIDSNACDTGWSVVNDKVTLIPVCVGYGSDENAGTETTYFEYSRQGACGENFAQYSNPFELTFGEFAVCLYTTDGIGNTETQVSFIHTADSSAYNLALLAELALAALLLMAIIGAVVLRGEGLSKELMIGLTVAAVIIVIAIVIFGTIL